MNQAHVAEGLLVHREGRIYEFMRKASSTVYFSDIGTGEIMSIAEVDLRDECSTGRTKVVQGISTPSRISFSPEQFSGQEEQSSPILLPSHCQIKLDRRLQYVVGIRRMGISRGQLRYLADAARRIAASLGEPVEAAPSAQTLNRWMGRFERGCLETMSLADGRWSRNPPVLAGNHEQLIQQAIDQKLLGEGRGNAAVIACYRTLVKDENRKRELVGLPPLRDVSDATVRRRIDRVPAFDQFAARHGIQQARKAFRMTKGQVPADFALQVAEIDHTQVDLYVVDDRLFLPLGIPWITVIRDRKTRAVLGFYVSFKKGALSSIYGALKHSLDAHHRIQEVWPEITNPWLSSGPATKYVMDRGPDFMSPRLQFVANSLGADLEWCERRTPWHKPYIERFCHAINSQLMETLPGRTYPFRKAPDGYDAKKHAVVRFTTLIYLLHKWVCDDYHQTPHSRDHTTPAQNWADSFAACPTPLPPAIEDLELVTGEPHRRSLSHEGVRHAWLNYASPELDEIRRRIGLDKSVEILTHDHVSYIHVKNPDTGTLLRVDVVQKQYAWGLTRMQHDYHLKLAKGKLNARNATKVLMNAKNEVQNDLKALIAQDETARRKSYGNHARRAGLNSNSVLEGKPQSLAATPDSGGEGWTTHEASISAGGISAADMSLYTDVPIYTTEVGHAG